MDWRSVSLSRAQYAQQLSLPLLKRHPDKHCSFSPLVPAKPASLRGNILNRFSSHPIPNIPSARQDLAFQSQSSPNRFHLHAPYFTYTFLSILIFQSNEVKKSLRLKKKTSDTYDILYVSGLRLGPFPIQPLMEVKIIYQKRWVKKEILKIIKVKTFSLFSFLKQLGRCDFHRIKRLNFQFKNVF